ncbi:MAG: glycosyltransferase family 9 protein [Pyrinomonadaceae bacterium]
MKVLIIKLSSIGDVVHTLPAATLIREVLPNAEISWAAEKGVSPLLENNPLIDRLHIVDTRSIRKKGSILEGLGAIRSAIRELKKLEFDVSIDFQGLLKSSVLASLSRSKRRIGFDRDNLREGAAANFYTDRFAYIDPINVINKNLRLAADGLQSLGVEVNVDPESFSTKFVLPSKSDAVNEASQIISRIDGPYAILNPAGGWITKLWPASRFGELALELKSEFGITSIVSTGPGEGLLRDEVLKSADGTAISMTPTLLGFFELAKNAAVYVGGDTAPTHLAVAANCPVVGIFGPTEWWRNGSPRNEDICVSRDDIDCRTNCHRRTCSNWICMDIAVKEVLSAVRSRLAAERSL